MPGFSLTHRAHAQEKCFRAQEAGNKLGSSGADNSGICFPPGSWEVGSSKGQVLCMTHNLAACNLQLNEASTECQVLTAQLLSGLQQELASRWPYICMLLDALTLLDLLSGFVAFMTAQKDSTGFCRPTLCPQKGHLHSLVPCRSQDARTCGIQCELFLCPVPDSV
jgi:hypothetical protein